jgi:hypothetical protein
MIDTTTEKTTADYDDREARTILAFAAEEFYPDKVAAGKAIDTLLSALGELGTRVPLKGLQIIRDPNKGVVVRTETYLSNRPSVGIMNNENGGIVLIESENGQTKGNHRVANLRFNPLSGSLEGTVDDMFIVPTPGQPRPKRAALAVVLEQAVALLRPKVEAEAASRRR